VRVPFQPAGGAYDNHTGHHDHGNGGHHHG
jgi:hypothetical protein